MRLLDRFRRRRRFAPGGVADLHRQVEEVGHSALSWTCMVCGKRRPDADIAVASASLDGWTVNIRYCRDTPECRTEADERAVRDAERLWQRVAEHAHED